MRCMDQHSWKMFLPAAEVLLDTGLTADKLRGLTSKDLRWRFTQVCLTPLR